jgi:hypothetical protein
MKAVVQNLLSPLSVNSDGNSIQIVHQRLVPYLNEIMDNQFMQFVQTLYELDIDENKILEFTQQQAIQASVIADLIIDRELLKIESRKKYKINTLDYPKDLLL